MPKAVMGRPWPLSLGRREESRLARDPGELRHQILAGRFPLRGEGRHAMLWPCAGDGRYAVVVLFKNRETAIERSRRPGISCCRTCDPLRHLYCDLGTDCARDGPPRPRQPIGFRHGSPIWEGEQAP
jgi:hypothetical protein